MATFLAQIRLALDNAFTPGINQAKTALGGMKNALGSINNGSGMMQVARDISVATSMTEPFRQKLSGMLSEPSELAAKLNSTFTNIKTVTGKTGNEMKSLSSDIISIGGKSTSGLQATANAFYDIAGGVQDSSVHMAMLKSAISLSEAGQADLGASTKGLISVMNAYKFSADQANFASDVFTRTVGMGVGTMDEFVSAMSPIAGLTASVNIPFDELGVSMAFMTTQGTSASMSANRLQGAVIALMKPNKEMASAIARSGYESGTAMIKNLGLAGTLSILSDAMGGSQDKMAEALGSVEALQAAVTLTKGGFGDFAKSYENGLAGITAASQKTQLEAYEAKVGRLTSAKQVFAEKVGKASNVIKGFGIDIASTGISMLNALGNVPGLSWIPALAGGSMTVANSLLGIGSAALNTTAQIATVAAMAEKSGGFIKLFGSSLKLLGTPLTMLKSGFLSVIPAVWSFTVSLLACPITWIILGVIALGAAAFLIIKNWNAVSGFFKNLWNSITNSFKKAWNFIWNGLLNNKGIQTALAVFTPFIGIPILIIKNWTAIKTFFTGLPQFFSDIGKKIYEGLTGGLGKAWEFLSGILKLGGEKAPKTMAEGVKKDKKSLKDSFLSIFNTADETIPHSDAKTGPFSRLSNAGRSIISTMATGVLSNQDVLKDSLNESFNGSIDFDNEKKYTGITKRSDNKTIYINVYVEKLVDKIDEIKKTQDFVNIIGQMCGVVP